MDFPVPVLQRGLVARARVSSTGNTAEYLFSRRPAVIGHNRGHFPVPVSRNNAE